MQTMQIKEITVRVNEEKWLNGNVLEMNGCGNRLSQYFSAMKDKFQPLCNFLEFSVPQNPHFNRCHFSITQKLEKICELLINPSSQFYSFVPELTMKLIKSIYFTQH